MEKKYIFITKFGYVKKLENWYIYFLLLVMACNSANTKKEPAETNITNAKESYGYDAGFLKKYTTNLVELSDEAGLTKVLVSADFQGRVMTSTATGDTGTSFGWLNYELISTGEKKKQFNPVGGEERFWMGPEGGQYSIYFKGGDSFHISNWQVPAFIDTDMYAVTRSNKTSATFSKKARITNFKGTIFDIAIERKISLLTKDLLMSRLQTDIPVNLHFVGFETINKVTNTGGNDWTKEKGLLSIWLLGMFTPSDETIVIIPFHPFSKGDGFITADYFGEIPKERLRVTDSVLYFTCDGRHRSKIGISPAIAKPIAGSYDFNKNILTVVIPELYKKEAYLNSKWEIQSQPYQGDVINAYNDGPLADGTQMGPFYEIESSSPALALRIGETGEYTSVTCHFQGNVEALKQLAIKLFGVDLDTIKK